MSRVILIIGASSDVGIELIKQINSSDTNDCIYAHYNSSSEKIKSIECQNGNKIIPIQANLADDMDIDKLINTIKADNNIPSVIVHLPAPKLDFIKFKNLNWEECIYDANVQVGSAVKIIQSFLPKMIKADERAKVVFMLSENTVIEPAKFSTKYTMSKYMLLGLMKSLAVEYEGKNVNINALSPTMIDTKLLSNIDRRMLEMTGVADAMLSADYAAEYLVKMISSESDNQYGENIYLSSKE